MLPQSRRNERDFDGPTPGSTPRVVKNRIRTQTFGLLVLKGCSIGFLAPFHQGVLGEGSDGQFPLKFECFGTVPTQIRGYNLVLIFILALSAASLVFIGFRDAAIPPDLAHAQGAMSTWSDRSAPQDPPKAAHPMTWLWLRSFLICFLAPLPLPKRVRTVIYIIQSRVSGRFRPGYGDLFF